MWKTPGSPDKGLLLPSFSCPSLKRRDGGMELLNQLPGLHQTPMCEWVHRHPPPPSSPTALCTPHPPTLFSIARPLFPYGHMDKHNNVQLQLRLLLRKTGLLFFSCSLLSRGVTTFCAFSFRRSRPSLKCSNAVCF